MRMDIPVTAVSAGLGGQALVGITRLCCALLQVVELNVEVEDEGPHNPHNNAFFAKETLLRTELDAARDVEPLKARHWVVGA